MALSNEFGWMVLTTGNKSEMAVGYFTIYGDSVGGYAVIKDVLKTRVYDLCRYVNERAGREIVPESVITKPPSAELRPDQRDDQSLPPYEVLDPILELYVEHDRTAAEIIEAGHDDDDRPPRHPARRPRRVQAPPVPARREGHHQGVRPRPPAADHQRLPRLSLRRTAEPRRAGAGHRRRGEERPDDREHSAAPLMPWWSYNHVAGIVVTALPTVAAAITMARPRAGLPARDHRRSGWR